MNLQTLRGYLVRILKPVIIFVGKIHAPYSVKSAAKHFHHLVDIMQPGDVILATTRAHLSNFGNPGKYKHAILYVGLEGNIPTIIEAIGAGVVKRSLVECIAEKDFVAVVRSNDIQIDSPGLKDGLRFAHEMVGRPYDYEFDMVDEHHKFDNFFCSELCLATWQKINPDISFTLMKSLGVMTASPNDFYRAAPKKTTVLFEMADK